MLTLDGLGRRPLNWLPGCQAGFHSPSEAPSVILVLSAIRMSSVIRVLSVLSVLWVIRTPTHLLLVLSVPPGVVLHAAQPYTVNAPDLCRKE